MPNIRNSSESVIIFAKEPVAGRVKTRLAATMGKEPAACVYRLMSAIALHEALMTRRKVLIGYDSSGSEHSIKKQLKGAHHFFRQSDADLGGRMKHAFLTAVRRHQSTKTVLIGSDCPSVSHRLLSRALRELNRNEAVLAPSDDGGYSLIGFRASAVKNPEKLSAVFDGMQWSHSGVLKETLNRMDASEIRYGLLPVCSDLDEVRCWKTADLQDLFLHRKQV